MKDNCLTLLLIFLTGILAVACSPGAATSSETVRIDSLVATLKQESFNNPDSILSVANKLLDEVQQDVNTARLLLLIASIHGLKGNYDSSIISAESGIGLAGNNKDLLARLNNELGVSYDYKGDYRNALDYYHKAQNYFQQSQDTSGYIKVRNNIGLIYQNTGELERAKEMFEECLKLSRAKQYQEDEVMALSNLAAVENESENYSTALLYFREVLAADIRSNNEAYISYSYHNIAEAHKNLRFFDSAVYYFTNAIRIKEKLALQSALINSYKGYSDLLMEMNRLSEAEVYLDKAFALAKEIGTRDYLQDCFYLQSRLAEKKGDYKLAYTAADSFHTIKDSLSNAKFRTELVVKEKDHEIDANEKIRKAEQQEFEAERLTFVLFIGFLAIGAGLLFWLLNKQRKWNRQLQQQKTRIEDVLVQRSQLLSFIAHEIRSPLGGIMGLTDLMLADKPTPDQRELLEYQKKASTHLLTLMNDVLDYQKLGSGKVELTNIRFNFRDVLYQVYALFKADIRQKQLSYDLDYDPLIPPALIGDPVRLTQVFSNLLTNAIKFTEKGTISISAEMVTKTATEATILCTVADSGVGIPGEDQERIFELYVQSSNNKSQQLGTGLGLSIVKNLLSLMNSKIQLQSEVGKGTTFSFTITFRIAE